MVLCMVVTLISWNLAETHENGTTPQTMDNELNLWGKLEYGICLVTKGILNVFKHAFNTPFNMARANPYEDIDRENKSKQEAQESTEYFFM